MSLQAVGAAVLTNVPMQGSMVMPMLRYHAGTGALTVTVDPAVPALTPLLVSHPGDRFDPADPWYDCLDPSCQGQAFSRRYGFVMDTSTDPLPAGVAIWLRKLDSTAGLDVYRYRGMGTKVWEPIFGTAGSTNALRWDGLMFHPAFTAAALEGTHRATFDAFLMDETSGQPLPGGNTGPFVFNFTVISDGRPALKIRPSVTVSWALSATNYVLESAATLPSASWTTVTNTPVVLEGENAVVLDPGKAAEYLRLRQLP
ncbi:hypothetical protein EG831_10165 [bacterium]|nr:hypothetical protein [bacterium]